MKTTANNDSNVDMLCTLLQGRADFYLLGMKDEERIFTRGLLSQVAMQINGREKRGITAGVYLSATYVIFGESFLKSYWLGLRKFWAMPVVGVDEDLLERNLAHRADTVTRSNEMAWDELVHMHLWLKALTDQCDNLHAVIKHLEKRKLFNNLDVYPAKMVLNCLERLCADLALSISDSDLFGKYSRFYN